MIQTSIEIIFKEISKLSNNDKIVLLSRLMIEISRNFEKDQKNDFYNIKGVGKEIWEGIDAQEYVNKERASWE
ncbi:hypothetical protein JXL19_10915 [bacterium]|nr:hypothetical protein [bacterium]